ncbi:pimeloyl-[acyl-carrier protein] methyl ester esterase isoform X2 [Capsicum annuum]|uniref:pimeloyl-[acyl-carrier protein] methyl ester esterase isoform X2 n=1 Tax=Capsicum annuum TaxID=4072 RepID=UPI001FB0880C|nr:pimeloyl-[acyl-carrier protein] methyl ester esterase isoform X2 [Capsicum annuum]
MPSKCFSFTATKNRCLKSSFSSRGLRSTFTDLKDGTIMHCWVPKSRKTTRPDLILIHGFGANSMWQWADTVRILSTHFNVYVPDLVFFGDSFTTRPERTESFQAECVKRVMEANSVTKMSVVGLSYGGFVAYAMAAQFRDCIEKVVICCAGVCLEEKDLKEGLFAVSSVEDAANILLPQTAEKMRELMGYTFVKAPAKVLPSCLLTDFIDEMFTQYVEEKKELLLAIAKDRKLSDLPKITQPTLIVWGDQDKIFPLELGHRLKRQIGENAQLVVIKNAGHAFLYEKPKDFHKPLKSFLLGSTKSPPPNNPQDQT